MRRWQSLWDFRPVSQRTGGSPAHVANSETWFWFQCDRGVFASVIKFLKVSVITLFSFYPLTRSVSRAPLCYLTLENIFASPTYTSVQLQTRWRLSAVAGLAEKKSSDSKSAAQPGMGRTAPLLLAGWLCLCQKAQPEECRSGKGPCLAYSSHASTQHIKTNLCPPAEKPADNRLRSVVAAGAGTSSYATPARRGNDKAQGIQKKGRNVLLQRVQAWWQEGRRLPLSRAPESAALSRAPFRVAGWKLLLPLLIFCLELHSFLNRSLSLP